MNGELDENLAQALKDFGLDIDRPTGSGDSVAPCAFQAVQQELVVDNDAAESSNSFTEITPSSLDEENREVTNTTGKDDSGSAKCRRGRRGISQCIGCGRLDSVPSYDEPPTWAAGIDEPNAENGIFMVRCRICGGAQEERLRGFTSAPNPNQEISSAFTKISPLVFEGNEVMDVARALCGQDVSFLND